MRDALLRYNRQSFLRRLRIAVWKMTESVVVATVALLAGGTLSCLLIKPVWMWVSWLWTNLY